MRTDRRGFFGRLLGGLLVAHVAATEAPASSTGGVGTFGDGARVRLHGGETIVPIIPAGRYARFQAEIDYQLLIAAGVDPRTLPRELLRRRAGL